MKPTRSKRIRQVHLSFETLESRQLLAIDFSLLPFVHVATTSTPGTFIGCGNSYGEGGLLGPVPPGLILDADSPGVILGPVPPSVVPVSTEPSDGPENAQPDSDSVTQLGDADFKAIEIQLNPNNRGTKIWRDFNLQGPDGEGLAIQLPISITHAVFNPDSGTIFAISHHELYELNPDNGEMKLLSFNADADRPSWLSGVAYDSVRQRIIVASTGGGGFLHAVSVETGQWSEIVELVRGTDVVAIAYDTDRDQIWALENSGPDMSLTAYNYEGERSETISLTDKVVDGLARYLDSSPQLRYVQGTVIIVSSNVHPHTGTVNGTRDQFIYQVDLQTRSVVLTSQTPLSNEQANGDVEDVFADGLPRPNQPEVAPPELTTMFDEVDEVHWVSVHDNDTSERATVIIDRPGQTVGVVLTSSSRARWNIVATEGTVIKSVLLGGYAGQSLTGVGDEVIVVRATYYDGQLPDVEYLLSSGDIDSYQLREAVEHLFDLTGGVASSYFWQYEYTQPISVSSVSDDVRLRPDFPGVIDPALLPDMEFQGIEYVDVPIEGTDLANRTAYLVFYSLTGPKQDAVRIELPSATGSGSYSDGEGNIRDVEFTVPWTTDWAYQSNSNFIYGISGSGLIMVDLTTGEFEEIEMPAINEGRNSIGGVTYDSARDRLVLAVEGSGLDGVKLVEYSLAEHTWNVFAQHPSYPYNIEALAYDADSEQIWALLDRERANGMDLVSFDSDGNITQTIALGNKIVDGLNRYGTAANNPQLHIEDGKIVFVSSAIDYLHRGRDFGYEESMIYLIDPVTESVQLTWYTGDHFIISDMDGGIDDGDDVGGDEDSITDSNDGHAETGEDTGNDAIAGSDPGSDTDPSLGTDPGADDDDESRDNGPVDVVTTIDQLTVHPPLICEIAIPTETNPIVIQPVKTTPQVKTTPPVEFDSDTAQLLQADLDLMPRPVETNFEHWNDMAMSEFFPAEHLAIAIQSFESGAQLDSKRTVVEVNEPVPGLVDSELDANELAIDLVKPFSDSDNLANLTTVHRSEK